MSLRRIFALYVLFSLSLMAQTGLENEISDSTKAKSEFHYLLYNKYSSPLYNRVEGIDSFITPDYSFVFQEQSIQPLSEKMKIEMSKFQFYDALGKIPEFRKKNDLGVLGDILMYTNTAATMYILYKHIEKYGLK